MFGRGDQAEYQDAMLFTEKTNKGRKRDENMSVLNMEW